ncbi:ribonuclease H-like domain-containing protein [Tanacetum coccineum]
MAYHDQQWYMDTGATSYLSSHTGNLQTSFLNRNFHSVIVGNRSSIPVTHYGHVQIPNLYHPFHLRNVLVTPNISKNLVSVQKFTTDNKCSIDFDPYGFTIQDYHTRQTLLCCDSTGHPGDAEPFDLGLQLLRSTTSQLIAYSDVDWADTLCHSSAEAEYHGVANAVAETSWIRNLLRELHTPLFTATLVYCDNVMAILVISVSSDSLEESVRTSARRVILFGTIPTSIPDTTPVITLPTIQTDTTYIPIIAPTIPPSPDYTLTSLDYSPASDTESDPSEDPS